MEKKETNKKGNQAQPPYIDDVTAQKLVKLAKDFFADPKNAEAYRQWHFENYGCWPEDERR